LRPRPSSSSSKPDAVVIIHALARPPSSSSKPAAAVIIYALARPRPPSSSSKSDADRALGHHHRRPSRTPTAPSATIVVVQERRPKLSSVPILAPTSKLEEKCGSSSSSLLLHPSAVEGQTVDQDVKCIIDCGDVSKLIGKRVRLVDIEMQHVANGILISTEIEKVVMGRKIGTEYCYGPSMMLLGFDFMLTNIAGLHTLTICMNIAR
ncbi:hypothetical protein Taro_028541, partial [Colocasia esculenta]|nr:hypothetical protein [Colocasia esculenta]